MLGDILKALSLSKQESDIFMQLARLDSAPASRIAQKTRLKRTTCYQLLEDLVKRNIIKRSIKYGVRYYTAATPSELVVILDKRSEPLLAAKSQLAKNISEIEKFYHGGAQNTAISFYEGYDEIKLIYDKILAQDDSDIYSILRKMDTTNHPLSEYWKKYLKERLAKRKKSYSIVPADQQAETYLKSSRVEKRMAVKVDPDDIEIYGDLKVCGRLVGLVSQHEGRIFGITIEDEKIAKMFKGMIKTLWKHYS